MTTAPVRYEVSTCWHCGEPIVRLVIDGKRADVLLRWLHTPARVHCLNRWREVLPTVAEPTAVPAPVVRLSRPRSVSDVSRQGRWAA